jgi:hypothetical protein
MDDLSGVPPARLDERDLHAVTVPHPALLPAGGAAGSRRDR